MFRFRWSIEESEWARLKSVVSDNAAESEYDTNFLAHYRDLYGSLAILNDEGSLFQQDMVDTISMSMLDLGYQLPLVVEDLKRQPQAKFSTADDGLEVYLTRDQQMLTITTNYFEPKLLVPLEEFERACHELLIELACRIKKHVPELLLWKSAGSIAAYAQT
jgi:hypothetical protein